MKIAVDTERKTCEITGANEAKSLDLFSKEAFETITRLWLDVGWVRKYSYGFSWLGRPVIQLPNDMLRIQEVIFQLQPDVIIETGIAHGGSLIFYASLFELLDKGRVIGVDVEIRAHNRSAIEAHPMSKRITMIEGNSVAPEIVGKVKSMISPKDKVMLILDSNHSRDHVSAELEAYSGLVTPGSYILSQDGVMKYLAGMPRTGPDWDVNNPMVANAQFLARHPEFEVVNAPRLFDESLDTPDVTYHPEGWMRRRS